MRLNRISCRSALIRPIVSKKVFFAAAFVVIVSMLPASASAFDITGGPEWQERVGPGISASLGFNGCLRDFCDDRWDTGASIGATVGFFYRIIPNLVVYVEVHTGHIPVDYDRDRWSDIDDDNGLAFQVTGGAEFHVPLTGWVAPYMGFGMGFAYLGVWGEVDGLPANQDGDFHSSLRGLDFQLKFGADFYPFSRVPSLSLGPILNLGLPYWVKACWKQDFGPDDDEECDDVDDDPFDIDGDETPFILYFGVLLRYGF